MRHECIDNIDDKARVWTITMGPDGKLQEELDARFLAQPCDDVADALTAAAGRTEVAETRIW
jgi:hypothetical protein